MTKSYQAKLIKLAKELRSLHVKFNNDYDGIMFAQKLNYLLGFILALEEE